jgi:hypothetical protein
MLCSGRGVNAIPQTGTCEHLLEDRSAADLRLTERDLRMLDEAFPAPRAPSRWGCSDEPLAFRTPAAAHRPHSLTCRGMPRDPSHW